MTAAPGYAGLMDEAIELLRSRLAASSVWAFKDARTSRLLFFWREAFTHVGASGRYILALRDPLSVAESMREMFGLKPRLSYAIWLDFAVRSIQDSLDQPQLVVSYDRLLADPGAQVRRIARKFGIESSINEAELALYQNEFIDKSLCHAAFTQADVARRCAGVPLAAECFDLLTRAAADELTGKDFLNSWSRLVQRYSQDRPGFMAANPDLTDPKRLRISFASRWALRLKKRGWAAVGDFCQAAARRALPKKHG